jgi:hypothetical protein
MKQNNKESNARIKKEKKEKIDKGRNNRRKGLILLAR